MPDLLLTHGYFLFEDEKELRIMRPYPPLGILYISAYLRQLGFDVEVFDSTFANRGDLYARFLAAGKGVVGIYTNLITRRSVLEIVRAAKHAGWTVILGGPESANYPERYIEYGADVVVLGEGEETMRDLLEELPKRGPQQLHGISGTVFRDGSGNIVKNPPRAQIADLDSLPWPDRSQIDQQRYIDVWRVQHGMGSVNLITARGCPYKCRWCSHAVFGHTHRRRSFLNCVDELEYIANTWHPDQVWYADDVFTIHHGWLRSYAAELKRRNLKIPFETISRADRMMKEEILQTLADMGCYRIWIGSESGSQKILDSMERGVSVEQVQWASRMAQRYGIEVGMFLMWGYEGETLEDIEATIEHVKKCNPNTFLTTVAYPIMNTAYFKRVSDLVVIDRPWIEATDRDYKIRGRHSRKYYEHADLWLRNEVAAFRSEQDDPRGAAEKRLTALQAREALLSASGEVEA